MKGARAKLALTALVGLGLYGCGSDMMVTPDRPAVDMGVDHAELPPPPDHGVPDHPAPDGPAPDMPPACAPDGGTECEPNDDPFSQANPITLGQALTGTIAMAGDVDSFIFDGNAGDLLRITLEPLGAGFDVQNFLTTAVGVLLRLDGQNAFYERLLIQQEAGKATRQIFLTQQAQYVLQVGPAGNHQIFNPQGNMAGFSGGDNFTYTLKIEKLPAPTPMDIAMLPATGVTQPLAPGDIHFYKVAATPGFLGVRLTPDMIADMGPILDIWDPTQNKLLAQSDRGSDTSASTLAPIAAAGDYWLVVDHFQLLGNMPAYQLNAEQPPAAPNGTCGTALDFATNGTDAGNGGKSFQAWTSSTNQVAISAPAGSMGMCLDNPTTVDVNTTGPEVLYKVNVPAGQRLAARLDSEFDGALYFATDCTSQVTTLSSCVAGVDATSVGEAVLYQNTTMAAQDVYVFVDTANQYGGFFNLLLNPNGQCTVSPDCEASTQLGDYCQDLLCVDPTGGTGLRFPADTNTSTAGVAIADGGDCSSAAAPGSPTVAKFTVPAGTGTVAKVHVYVDIKHSYRGDLVLKLKGPDMTEVALTAFANDGTDDYLTVFPDQTALPMGQSLDSFIGKTADGEWDLTITDNCSVDTGTLRKAVLLIEKQ